MEIVNKTLEEIELNVWPPLASGASSLVTKCNSLRKKKLGEFDVEDFRIMIGQKIGLAVLVPLAIEMLREDPFLEGDYYEGDLLETVLRCGCDFWTHNTELANGMRDVIASTLQRIDDVDLVDKIKESILGSIKDFENCQQ